MDKKQIISQLRDKFKTPPARSEKDKLYQLQREFYETMGKADLFDGEYYDHINDDNTQRLLNDIEDLSLSECSTILTFLYRVGVRGSEGRIFEEILDGTIYNRYLSRICDVL